MDEEMPIECDTCDHGEIHEREHKEGNIMQRHRILTLVAVMRSLSARRGASLLLAIALIATFAFSAVPPVTAGSGTDRLTTSERLYAGGFLISPNKRYQARMQKDGNFVVYAFPDTTTPVALWSSRTNGNYYAWLVNQPDGNLVVYTWEPYGIALWSTRTNGRGTSTLVMQDDGNLVLYSNTNPPWASGTVSSDKLPDWVARQTLRDAGIPVVSTGNCTDRYNKYCTSLEQIRRATITGVRGFKRASGCYVTVTGGTEVGHSTSGTYTHWNGYKIDIKRTDCVTNYIKGRYTHIGTRSSDGSPLYRDPAGNIYADEYKKNHWDILYY